MMCFLSVKRTVQHLAHMHYLGEFQGHFIVFYLRSALFFRCICVRGGFVCDVRGVAYYSR